MWSNVFSFLPWIDLRWVTVSLSSIALNLTLVASLASWTLIHPFILFELELSSWETLYPQLYVMGVHTLPLVCSYTNYLFLTDAPIYIQDIPVSVSIINIYMIWNFLYWATTGEIQYDFLNWGDSSQWWMIPVTYFFLIGAVVVSNTSIALISQALSGNWEWNEHWVIWLITGQEAVE